MGLFKNWFGGVQNADNDLFPEVWRMPVGGEIVALADVPDPAFASGALGEGFAIKPDSGVIVAPVDGVITELFTTLHALSLQADNGLQILLHIGIDTVTLGGRGFSAKVSQGDTVYAGQPLIEVNWDLVRAQGLSTLVAVIFTNLEGRKITVKGGKPVLL